jgi:hypothetical protein
MIYYHGVVHCIFVVNNYMIGINSSTIIPKVVVLVVMIIIIATAIKTTNHYVSNYYFHITIVCVYIF